MDGNESKEEIMREIKIKNAYGRMITLNVELSEESRKTFPPECLKCWDDPEVWERESAMCNEYGPCNFHPIIKEDGQHE